MNTSNNIDINEINNNLNEVNNNLNDLNIEPKILNFQTQVKEDWTEDHELVLVEWADKAMCYRWLHARSNIAYSNLHLLFTIPVIIMSTLTGTANFAFQKYDLYIQNIASSIIGCINIFAAILSTVAQFLKIAELNEAHRVSGIAWDKFYRNIKVELAKHPNERMSPLHMLKISKEEFDRLMETSPNIKANIIADFKKTFNFSNDVIKQTKFEHLKKPEICDELISTDEFRHHWFKQDPTIRSIETCKELEMRRETSTKKKIQYNNELIKFKTSFYQLHNREPLETEIIDNLKDTIEENILQQLLNNNKNFNMV